MSFNPLVTGTYLSSSMVAFGVLVIAVLFVLDERTPVLRMDQVIKAKVPPRSYQIIQVDRHVWVWLGVGFGCQLFLVQLLYIDPNIVLRWCGIPNTGFS